MGKKLTGFIITAGHLDIEWYQPLRSYRFWTMQTFKDLKEAVKREDFDCYVLDGQVFPLEEYLQVMPQDEQQMRRMIDEGKLVVGPFYTQFDEWLPSAESLIRNCLYGKRRAEDFGGYMRAGYLPDNFGHPRQLPQLLSGFGIDSLLFMRGMPEIKGDHPDEFLYEGIDGTRILASHFRESYSGAFDIFNKDIDPIQPREVPYYPDYLSFEWHRELAEHDDPQRTAENMIENVKRIGYRYPSDVIPLIAGFDHLPPQINIGDSVKVANDIQSDIEFVMGTAQDYIELVYSKLDKPSVFNMELLGSKYQNILLGALSTRAYLKRENFACEMLMERYVEPLSALTAKSGYNLNTILMDEAWEYLMINSAHDSIHGSSVDEVHTEMQTRNASVRQIASGLIHEMMCHTAEHSTHWWKKLAAATQEIKLEVAFPTRKEKVATTFEPKGIVVFAPSHSECAQPAELWLPVHDVPVQIVKADGTVLPTQVVQREPLELNGLLQPSYEPFPSLAYRKVMFTDRFSTAELATYAVVPADKEPVSPFTATDTSLENEHIKVDIKGALINICDKRTGSCFYGLNLLQEEADAGDAWDFSPTWTPSALIQSTASKFTSRLVECGAVKCTVEVTGEMCVPYSLYGDERSEKTAVMPVKFSISLLRDTARVDVKLTIDNTAKDHRIRLKISPNLRTESVRSQSHVAIVDRPIELIKEIARWYQPVSQLMPFREWVAVEEQDRGLAVAFKGVYDYEAIRNPLTCCPDIYFTLLRGIGRMGRLNTMQRAGSASWAQETPQAQSLGEHVIEWCYMPYAAQPDEKAPFIEQANTFFCPPVAHAVRTTQIDTIADDTAKAYSWKDKNIQFYTFKRTYENDANILRLYENQGKATEVCITLGDAQKVFLCDLNEQPQSELTIKDGCVNVSFEPYKIKTLKIL